MSIFKKLNYFFYILSFLSFVLIFRLIFTLIVFYWNIPQTDDFCFMAKIYDFGLFGSIKWWYLNWQGRYLPQLFTNFILFLYKASDNMLLYGILIVFLFCFSLYRCIVNLFLKFNFKPNIYDNLTLITFSISIFCLLLDFHMDTSTLYWVNVSTMYFLGIIFLLLGLSELLRPQSGFPSYLVLTFSFLYVGCSSEHFAFLVLSLLFLFFILQQYFSYIFGKYFFHNKLFWAFITCLTSFLVMYLAPGNSVRLSSTQEPSFLKGLQNIPEFLNILYFNRLSINSGYLCLTFFFSLAYGSFFSKRLIINGLQLKKILILSSSIVLYLILGTIFIFSFLLDYKGSTRAFVHISLAVTLFISCFGFLFGVFINPLQRMYVNFIFFLSVSIYFSTVLFKFKFHLRPTINYELSVRQRLFKVKEMAKMNYPLVILPKLENNPKNILLNGELASEKEDKTLLVFNKCLNSAFGMKDKPIILVESE
jgi:hypothetical protein